MERTEKTYPDKVRGDELMWWLDVPCPLESNGLIRPVLTASGTTVLLCDECDSVWLTPASVETDPALYPSHPDWEVEPGVYVTPGTLRWLTFQELPEDWRVWPWRSGAL